MMRKDYLSDTGLTIYQDPNNFCMNTDTRLLGKFLDFAKDKTVLDIGMGNGALLLYASLLSPRSLNGIDIDAEALKMAKLNMEANRIEATLEQCDLKDYKSAPFDVIICNPPYFKNTGQKRERLDRAKNEDYMPLPILFAGFKRLCKDNGSIYLIYHSKRLFELFRFCDEYGFRIMKMKLVYNEYKEAIRVLMKLKRGYSSEAKIESIEIVRRG